MGVLYACVYFFVHILELRLLQHRNNTNLKYILWKCGTIIILIYENGRISGDLFFQYLILYLIQ